MEKFSIYETPRTGIPRKKDDDRAGGGTPNNGLGSHAPEIFSNTLSNTALESSGPPGWWLMEWLSAHSAAKLIGALCAGRLSKVKSAPLRPRLSYPLVLVEEATAWANVLGSGGGVPLSGVLP